MADDVTDAELIRTALDSRLLSLHTSMPGRVVVYNPLLQTADVIPVIKRAVPTSDGELEHEELPVIHNVPIEWPGGGGFAMQFPITTGDHVWLIFSEAATAQWRTTGQISEPGDLRRHDLSYACAIWIRGPDLNTLLPLVPPNEARMDCPGPFVFGLQASAQFVANATLVLAELAAIVTSFNSHVHVSAGAGSPTAPPTVPMTAPTPVAATKLKAE